MTPDLMQALEHLHRVGESGTTISRTSPTSQILVEHGLAETFGSPERRIRLTAIGGRFADFFFQGVVQ